MKKGEPNGSRTEEATEVYQSQMSRMPRTQPHSSFQNVILV